MWIPRYQCVWSNCSRYPPLNITVYLVTYLWMFTLSIALWYLTLGLRYQGCRCLTTLSYSLQEIVLLFPQTLQLPPPDKYSCLLLFQSKFVLCKTVRQQTLLGNNSENRKFCELCAWTQREGDITHFLLTRVRAGPDLTPFIFKIFDICK
jgi:hypothetical protein